MTTMKTIKLKFNCHECGAKLKAPIEEAGTSSACPKCGKTLALPFPGIGRCAFVGWKFLKFLLASILAGADGGLLSIPLSLLFSVFLAHQRSINIGHSPWMAMVGLIPGSIFYFGAQRTGAVKTKILAIP